MDIQEIKTLTDLMVERDLSEVMIRDGDKRIVIRRGTIAPTPMAPAIIAPPTVSHGPAQHASPPSAVAPTADAGLLDIASPMVGTYYASPKPGEPAFVRVGDTVRPDTVVCIIEAMKVMNEIKADVAGVIESIEVANAAPVQYGQVLMKVRAA